MASSSVRVGYENDPLSDMEDEVEELLFDRDIQEYKGVPRHLWTTQCMSLHNNDGIAVGEGICHSVKSDLVVGSTGPLGDMHVAVHISKSLKLDEFPDDWRYSIWAWPIIHVFYNGASFFNHERWHKFNCRGLNPVVRSGWVDEEHPQLTWTFPR
jgi:hypothetical protein